MRNALNHSLIQAFFDHFNAPDGDAISMPVDGFSHVVADIGFIPPGKAVETAKILEVVAEMNYHALQLTRGDCRVPQYLLDKHYYRKHGANAYYGQGHAGTGK